MFNPFKPVRAKAVKRARKSSVSAFAKLAMVMMSPPKPARATSKKKSATTPKPKPVRRPGKAASFRSGTFSCEFGTRSYKLYMPASAKSSTVGVPLIVMLHGCGQTPDDFAKGTAMNVLAEEMGFIVLYPAQARQEHRNKCWNWYRRGDQARGAGEPALIASMTQYIIEAKNVDPAKVYVAGLSAGASAALILGATYPDVFAAVGAHSGLAVGAAHDAASAVIAMKLGALGSRSTGQMPTINFQGDADNVVNPRNGHCVANRALEPYSGLHQTVKKGRATGGRSYVRISNRIGTGRSFTEYWVITGSGHAWSGGNRSGSFTDPTGPDASKEMVRFFSKHRTTLQERKSGIDQ